MNILGSNEVPAGGPVLPNPAEVPAQGAFAAVLTGKLEAALPVQPPPAATPLPGQLSPTSSETHSTLPVELLSHSEVTPGTVVAGRTLAKAALMRSKAAPGKLKIQKAPSSRTESAAIETQQPAIAPLQAKAPETTTPQLHSALSNPPQPVISSQAQNLATAALVSLKAPPNGLPEAVTTGAAPVASTNAQPVLSLKMQTVMPLEVQPLETAPIVAVEARDRTAQPPVSLKVPLKTLEAGVPPVITQKAETLNPQSSISLKAQPVEIQPPILSKAGPGEGPPEALIKAQPAEVQPAISAQGQSLKIQTPVPAQSQPTGFQPPVPAQSQPTEFQPPVSDQSQPNEFLPPLSARLLPVESPPTASSQAQPVESQSALQVQAQAQAQAVKLQPVVPAQAQVSAVQSTIFVQTQAVELQPVIPAQAPPVEASPANAQPPQPKPEALEKNRLQALPALSAKEQPSNEVQSTFPLLVKELRVMPAEAAPAQTQPENQPASPPVDQALGLQPSNPPIRLLAGPASPARESQAPSTVNQVPIALVKPGEVKPIKSAEPTRIPTPVTRTQPERANTDKIDPLVKLDNLIPLPVSPNPMAQTAQSRQPELLQLVDNLPKKAGETASAPIAFPFRNENRGEIQRSPGLLERLQQPLARPAVELPKVVIGNFQQATAPEAEVQNPTEPSPTLPDHLVSLAVNLLKQQSNPSNQPLRQEILQRLQSTELPGTQPATVPVTSVVLAQVEKIQVESLEEQKPRSPESARVENEETPPILPTQLSSTTTPAPTAVRSQAEPSVQVPDAAENIQRLARQQSKALVDKPRELDVHLHSDRLGDVAAHLKVNPGGSWTAHVQLRDSGVEQSVRQELDQLSQTRGLEGFTTSLSQDRQEERGSFQGFSFHQEQQPRGHFGQGDLERRQRTYLGKSSSQASTSVESVPIDGLSSVQGTQTSGGLNVRA